MFRHAQYDAADNILWVDMSNHTLDKAFLQEFVTEFKKLIAPLPKKPYLAVFMENTILPAELKVDYGKASAEVAGMVKAVVRYGKIDFLTKLGLQTENINSGRQSNVFATKEQALTAIRAGEV
jgi:hypothetical protein